MSKENSQIKGNLLIIEDEIEFRDVLVEWLEGYADRIFVANNGKEGLAIIQSQQVDAVLTDIKMPIMTGLQFLAEIRLQSMQTPVIVLTGYADTTQTKEALRLDATDLLEKPCEPNLVEEAVQKALSYGLALREMEEQIEKFYSESALPADQIAQLKKIRRITQGMKLGFSSYTKKKVS